MEPRVTLLSQRSSGPQTDVSGALELLYRQLRPPVIHIPNLLSGSDAIGSRMSPPRSTSPYEHVYNSPPQTSPCQQLPSSSGLSQAPSRRTPTHASGRLTGQRSTSHTDPQALPMRGAGPIAAARTNTGGAATSTTTTPARSGRTPVQQRGAERVDRTGLNDFAPRDAAVGTVSVGERTRCRNHVSRKLLDLHKELSELCACRDRMRQQVSEAMCVDPRRTKETRGTVAVLAEPPAEQGEALDLLLQALDDAHAASIELVAAYLTPEEKRYLGVNTHLFQTRAEKATSYQYAPHRARNTAHTKKKKEEELSDQDSEQSSSPATTVDASRASSSRHCAHVEKARPAPSPASAVPSAEKQAEQVLATAPRDSRHLSSRHSRSAMAFSTASRDRAAATEPGAASSSPRSRSSKASASVGSSSAHGSHRATKSSVSTPAFTRREEKVAAVAAVGEKPSHEGISGDSSAFLSPANGPQRMEAPRSPAVPAEICLPTQSPTSAAGAASNAPELAPLLFNVKQLVIDSSTSTTERDVTPERVYQPKLSASTLDGSSQTSVGLPERVTPSFREATAATMVVAPATTPAVVLPTPAVVQSPWTVSTAATGTTAAAPTAAPAASQSSVRATPPPLPAAPAVPGVRAEFRRLMIDSDSDSSAR